MLFSIQRIVVSDHAYERYLQRHIGNDLSREELVDRLNKKYKMKSKGELKHQQMTLSKYGSKVIHLDGVKWCYEKLGDSTIILTTCLGSYDLKSFHHWEKRQRYQERMKRKRRV